MNLLETFRRAFGLAPQSPDSPSDTPVPAPSVNPAEATGLPPATQLREQIVRFILERLRTYQNEPGTAPTGIQLQILSPDAATETLYRVALWDTQPDRFRNELNRLLADNYVDMPEKWRFDYAFHADALPDSSYRSGNLGLTVLDANRSAGPVRLARLKALVGQTEQPDYVLDPDQKTSFCIGRGHTVQTASGRVRTNDIVFLTDTDPGFDTQRGAGNGAVSRAHASIHYVEKQHRYTLRVDAGGLPASGNKTKIIRADSTLERADIAGMDYPLQDGDQIELGGEAVLLFTLTPNPL